MSKRTSYTRAAILFTAGALTAFSCGAKAAPAPAVTVAEVTEQNIAPSHNFVGRVQSIQSVQIHAMIEGILQQVAFKEGSDVKAGQLLFVIDPDMFQAELKNAQAAVAKAQATLNNDNLVVARDKVLAPRGETPEATLDEAQATRDADAATLSAAQAQVQVAQINLGYTRIAAPIAGRIGAASVTAGNLVSSTSAVLATIVQLNPIRVVFSVDDTSFVSAEQKAGTSLDSLTKQFLPRLIFENGTVFDQTGRLEFVNNQVDAATGTISIYARFPNPDAILLPNQYVTVAVRPATPENRLLVPVAAVQEDNQGKYVLLVGADNKVSQQRFMATQQIGENWVVESGLKQGQKVIVAGVQKVHPGEAVNPQMESAAADGAASTLAAQSTPPGLGATSDSGPSTPQASP
jgi:membrane fusion protein, multidrug efflux system